MVRVPNAPEMKISSPPWVRLVEIDRSPEGQAGVCLAGHGKVDVDVGVELVFALAVDRIAVQSYLLPGSHVDCVRLAVKDPVTAENAHLGGAGDGYPPPGRMRSQRSPRARW